MYVFTGKLKIKRDTKQVSDRFKKREFVVTDDSSNYPEHVLFQLKQERCDLIDNYEVGDEIKVSFNLKGREWQKPNTDQVLYFNSLDAWKLEGTGAQDTQASGNGAPGASSPDAPPMPGNVDEPPLPDEEDEDLPF